ncbi:MAG TPA: hypothetical protein VMV25_01465 [Steroidobacteraceae bacterium]|nr:hypothetical protein [Steroidobacteraceae bacterium]
MGKPSAEGVALAARGIAVEREACVHVAALRHFDAETCSARLRRLLGEALPAPLHALRAQFANGGADCILLWRSPSETWLLCAAAAPIDALRKDWADAADACVVLQTGGIVALHVSGARTADLLARLGESTSMPRPMQALTARLADITVTLLGLQADEVLLLVERVYADHLFGWIRETLLDFPQ